LFSSISGNPPLHIRGSSHMKSRLACPPPSLPVEKAYDSTHLLCHKEDFLVPSVSPCLGLSVATAIANVFEKINIL
jgi:hypothetical protein